MPVPALRMLACFMLAGAANLRAADELKIGPSPTPYGELVRLAKADPPPAAADLLPHYLNRQWDRLTGKADPSSKPKVKTPPLDTKEQARLKRWFEARPSFRERLLLALDPERDDIRAGARVALRILEEHSEAALDENLERLIVAFAIVWDQPAAAVGEQTRSARPMKWEENFAWLAKHVRHLAPHFGKLPVRFQVFAAADQISKQERDWAQKVFNYRGGLGASFFACLPEDTQAVKGYTSKLEKAKAEYTLQNLHRYGGKPEERAYFAAEGLRALGVPAVATHGPGSTGQQAFGVAWIDPEGEGWALKQHDATTRERVFAPKFYDPRGGEELALSTLDLEALLWSGETSAYKAELFWRVYQETGWELKAEPRTNLLRAAVGENLFHGAAWLALGDAVAENRLPRAAATQLWDLLKDKFKDHPDLVHELVTRFARAFSQDQEQIEYFERASAFFAAQERPDLAAKLRLEQVALLTKRDKQAEAAKAAADGLRQCGGDGSGSAELGEALVDLARNLGRLGDAEEPLKTAAGRLPVVRQFKVNPHWLNLNNLLLKVYQETGNETAADEIKNRVATQVRNALGYFKDKE